MLYDTIPLNHSDTSSLYQSYSRLRRHPDRGWLYSLTRDHQYSRAVHAAHHSHLLGTNLWVQMPTPLQTRGEGRLAILRRATTQDTCWSDHSNHYHTTLGNRVTRRNSFSFENNSSQSALTADRLDTGADRRVLH